MSLMKYVAGVVVERSIETEEEDEEDVAVVEDEDEDEDVEMNRILRDITAPLYIQLLSTMETRLFAVISGRPKAQGENPRNGCVLKLETSNLWVLG